MASFAARFECSICQGTSEDANFCSLNCGHCFHTSCAYQWLERSQTCPACRASAKRRQVRAITGIDVVQDAADAGAADTSQGDQQQLITQLQRQLDTAERQGQELEVAVQQLESVQDELKRSLKKYKHRCAELECQRLQDAERLMTVNAELSSLKESYWDKKEAVERLKQALQEEQSRRAEAELKRKRAEADMKHLQLQNPALGMHAMQHLISSVDKDLQGLNQQQLLLTLGRRNEQLKQAEACSAALQEQLQQQQQAAEAQRVAVLSKQQAHEARVVKQQDESMKQVINLEYKVDKLEQEKAALAQQLQDLQGVLLALEGRGTTVQRTNTHPQPQQAPMQQPVSSSRCQPVSSFDLGLDLSQSSSDKENDCPAAEQATQAADDWEADVTAAVGPGSLLRRPAHIAQAPSFLKSGVAGAACGLKVQGQLLRQGPDGKGSTAKHMPSFTGKKGVMKEPLKVTGKRPRGASVPSTTGNIMSFFGKKT